MSKSSYHRSENTFKFQTFGDRLAQVNVDVARRIQRTSSTPEDADTFFGAAFDRWVEFNCTRHFQDFRKEVSNEIHSLAQLVHHQNAIVDMLHRHLQVTNSLAYQPLLDLTSHLARDLQADFYPHFASTLSVIISVLQRCHHDVDTLEQAFSCLAYIFKFLWRTMLGDIQNVYTLFSPLLGGDYRDYINSFAAESFAFLLRKVKNHDDLFDFIFSRFTDSPDQASGVGHLLFGCVKGVQNQFHTVADKVIPVLLRKLSNPKLPLDEVAECMIELWTCMAGHAAPQSTQGVWTALLEEVRYLHQKGFKSKVKGSPARAKGLLHILSLIQNWIDYKNGLLVTAVDELTQVLIELLEVSPLPDSASEPLLTCVAHLLKASKCSIPPSRRVALTNAIFSSKIDYNHILAFCRDVFDVPLFEKDILGSLLSYSNQLIENEVDKFPGIIHLLTDLVLHKTPESSSRVYSLTLKSTGSESDLLSVMRSFLSKPVTKEMMEEDFAVLWSIITCVPHIRPMDVESWSRLLHQLLPQLNNTVRNYGQMQGMPLCVWAATIQCLVKIQSVSDLHQQLPLTTLVDMIKFAGGDVHVLCAVAAYLRQIKDSDMDNVLTAEVFGEIFECIQPNLSRPFSQVRRLTLEICTQFSFEYPSHPDNADDPESRVGVFAICLAAEQIEADMQTYRDKLVQLRKLDWSNVQSQVPVGPYAKVPLYYLLGAMYVNMKLMWQPLMELIASHALGMKRDEFWSVFGPQLEQAASRTEELLIHARKVANEEVMDTSAEDFDKSALCQLFEQQWDYEKHNKDRANHPIYRDHLWQSTHSFPDQCEARSKIIVPLFFKFLECEYYPADLMVAPTQNLQKDVDEEEEEDGDDDEDAGGDKASSKKERKQKAGKKRKRGQRATNKTFIHHLRLFSKIRNPKSLTREPELHKLYFELLCHRDVDVQKVAFQCILQYKYKYLTPYRENFENLLDDKNFKTEIVSFSLDSEQTIIQADHRPNILPFLMRILHGKMQTKTGKDTSGRAYSRLRKNLVLRFLAGCQPEELGIFLDLVFEPFKQFLSENLCEKVKEICNDVDSTAVIPLRKQIGMLSTMDVIYKKLSNLIEPYLPTLLHITVCLLSMCAKLLNERQNLRPQAINSLKMLRQILLARLKQFFENFPQYGWKSSEVDGLFEAAVWPQVEKLAHEGIYSPTGLLTLLQTFSSQPRYICLLGKCRQDGNKDNLLVYIFQLLHAKNVHASVLKVILTLVENLLESEKEEEQEAMDIDGKEGSVIPVSPMVEFLQPDLSIGVNLLLNHVPTILRYLKTVIETLTSATVAPKTSPTQELNILAKLSVFVSDAEESEQLISLLMPFLASKIQRPLNLEQSILEAVRNLLRQVMNPRHFLVVAAPLFSHLTSRKSRTLLTEGLRVIGERDSDVANTTDIMIRLNAWDRRMMEEPDYAVRLDAFAEASRLIQTSAPDVAQLTLLAHNAAYLISNVEDMSLRDSSSVCLRAIVKVVATHRDDSELFGQMILKQLLPLAKSGMRHKKEVVRHEFIQLLAEMVTNFSAEPCFSQLAKLSDAADIELDFFHNITHIQVHRRARAMKRLVKQTATLQLGTDCRGNYLLPIVTTFIKDETYAKQSNLLDGAVDAIGAICRGLPWPRYSAVLRQYLILLTKSVDQQKLMVRIVVAILDNFHFDLKNSSEMDTRSFAAHSAGKEEEKEAKAKDASENATEAGDGDGDEKQAMETDEHDASSDSDAGKDAAAVQENEVCAAGLATRIHRHILRSIIPQLHKVLTQKAKSDDEHKKAFAGKYAEDEEILRVPIALAMVKLLQNLPHKTLQHNLPGVLLKVCNFLKSRANDIRNIARDTLMKILQSMGASYFGFVLHELQATLKRGYQLHILGFTVWHLLHNLSSSLKPGDLDSCLSSIVQVCNDELFGEVSEEKEVDAIANKLHEAKTTKSYDTYALLSKNVTKSSIAKIILPVKELVMGTTSQKTARKVQDVLRYISKGVVQNTALDYMALLTFTYGLLTDTLPMLNTTKEKVKPSVATDPRLPPPSKLIIEAEPGRARVKAKTNLNANAYVIVEFGLQVLNLMLKHSMLVESNIDHLQRIDPFISTLAESLNAKNLKVTSTALRCLLWLLKFPLPSMKANIEHITNSLFVLLHNYATAGAAKGDNFELIVMCFKAVTVLVRDVKYHSIDESQLHVLLGYAEQDIHDHTRQATAFTLLRAILSRKLVVPQIPEVMSKVQQLSITADSPHVRLQCRQVCLQFLMDYPLGKKLYRHLEFYITQLDYEHEFGRESALEMMATIFATFPQNLLVQNAGFFFVPLASRLVNDDSAKCRKLSALAIKSLLSKLSNNDRDQLFSICLEWFQEEKVPIRRLAAHACGLLAEVEGTKFERHLAILLPIIEHEMEPDRAEQMGEESVVRDGDHLLFGVLTLLQKVLTECSIIRNESRRAQLNSIWGCVESHLMSGHSWVRLAAAQLYGQLFAAYTPHELSVRCTQTSSSMQSDTTQEYLHADTTQKIYQLCGNFCKQFSSTLLEQQLADQVVKNLVFVGHVLAHAPDVHLTSKQAADVGNDVEVSDDHPTKCASLSWLIRRLCREAKAEAANNPKSTVKRSSVFKWLAAIGAELGSDRLPDYLQLMLPPLLHQTTSSAQAQDESLKTLANEVVSLIKSTVGVEKFTQIYATAQKHLMQKRQERKQQKAFEAVANPEIAAKRKMKKNLHKQEAKKRKLDEFKPSRKSRKHKS